MKDFMSKFGEFWGTWGPWISLMLVPTIITGLSASPKTAKAASVISMMWDSFKQVLSLLSLATFKDTPGTFQIPLKLSSIRKKKPSKPSDKNSAGGCAAIVLIFAIGSSGALLQGCCSWRGTCAETDTGGQIATGAIDCAKETLKTQAAHLLPALMAILQGRAPNWKEQLDHLKGMGTDVFACAMSTASMHLLMRATPPEGEGFSAGQEELAARAKAKEDSDRATTRLQELKLTTVNVMP